MADLDPSITPPGQFLESRLSEDMFRRYEPLLAKAVSAFPAETSFTIPPGISPTTFLARFRDARLSYLRFDWTSDLITPDLRQKLINIQREHTISYDNATGLVWFRQKQRRGRPQELVVDAVSHLAQSSSPVDRVWQTWTDEELTAACVLLNSKKAVGPIILKGQLPDNTIIDLTSRFDISLVYQPDTGETVLT